MYALSCRAVVNADRVVGGGVDNHDKAIDRRLSAPFVCMYIH